MPYIAPKDREHFELWISKIIEIIIESAGSKHEKIFEALSGVVIKLLEEVTPEQRYWTLALNSGILHNIGDEMRARLKVNPGALLEDPYTHNIEIEEKLLTYIIMLAGEIRKISAKYGGGSSYAGLTNYCCTVITLRVIQKAMGNTPKFALLSKLPSLFYKLSDHYYKSAARPYENAQISKNGDLPEYQDIINKLGL